MDTYSKGAVLVILFHWLGAYSTRDSLFRSVLWTHLLSVVMTLRMCLRQSCFLLLIFHSMDLNHLVRMFYLFLFSVMRRLHFLDVVVLL